MLTEKPWKIESVLWLALALFCSMLSGVLLISMFRGETKPIEGQPDFLAFLIGTVSFHGAIIVSAHFFLRFHRVSWTEGFGLSSAGQGRAVALAIGTTILILPVAWAVGQLSGSVMKWFQVEPVAQKAVTTLQSTTAVGPQIYFAFMAVVLAPVAEEILFRGILYPALKQVWRAQPALWVTAIIFGAFHANLMTLVPLTLLAFALTWLYETTNNLFAPVLTHSLFNTANFFWLLLERPAS